MILSNSMILALAILLLPAPLACLIPVSAEAAPDPWKIRRMRATVVGFAVGIALIQLAYLWFQHRIFDGSPPGGPTSGVGVFIWAFMSWFLLASLVFELRRRPPESFPGDSRRTASLRPRHADSPVPSWAWWALAATWALTAAIALATAPERSTGTVLLLSAGVLVFLGRWLTNRSALVSEPLLPESQADLRRAYHWQRKIRGWTLFSVISVGVAYKIALAIALGWGAATDLIKILLGGAAALIVTTMVVYAVFEKRARRRIRHLRARPPERHP